MTKHVLVVGGGLAGLAASIYLARAGHTVTIFEKRRTLGGRAVTHLRHGYRFNLGPHSFFRSSSGAQVFRELGIPVRGGSPKLKAIALRTNGEHVLPATFLSILTSGPLGPAAKLEAARLVFKIRRLDAAKLAPGTTAEWLDANVHHPAVRESLLALLRFATYCEDPGPLAAAFALRQLRNALRGIVYADEGWQKIVDSLHSHAVAAGVNFVTSSRIVAVEHDDAVRAVQLGGFELDDDVMDTRSLALPPDLSILEKGTRFPCDNVVLAIDPENARELVPALDIPALSPITMTCLDVALSRLPNPKKSLVLGLDSPHYLGVHSQWAQLTPKGGAMIHVARYGRGTESELSALLDRFQPGWRDVLVHKRYLPSMTVSFAAPLAGQPRRSATTKIKGLYLAGDWIGDDGMLSDAALTSARAAARAIIA